MTDCKTFEKDTSLVLVTGGFGAGAFFFAVDPPDNCLGGVDSLPPLEAVDEVSERPPGLGPLESGRLLAEAVSPPPTFLPPSGWSKGVTRGIGQNSVRRSSIFASVSPRKYTEFSEENLHPKCNLI